MFNFFFLFLVIIGLKKQTQTSERGLCLEVLLLEREIHLLWKKRKSYFVQILTRTKIICEFFEKDKLQYLKARLVKLSWAKQNQRIVLGWHPLQDLYI